MVTDSCRDPGVTTNHVYDAIPDLDEAYRETRKYAIHRYNRNDGPKSS